MYQLSSGSYKLFFSFFLFLLFFLVFSSSYSHAQIVLNEFLPNTNTSGQPDEWIEIYNQTDHPVDLNGFTLQDNSSSFELAESISPRSFLILYKEITKISLNDSGDELKILNTQNQVIDEFEYQETSKGKSFARLPDGDGEWQITDIPTPGESNSKEDIAINPNSFSPEEIRINEFMACPESNQLEWLELKNNHDQPVSLVDWYFLDSVDNKITINLDIPALGLASIDWSKSVLNNSDDQIAIYTKAGLQIDSTSYQSCLTGYSHALQEDSWYLTSSHTRNQENIISLPTLKPSITTTPTKVPTLTNKKKVESSPTPESVNDIEKSKTADSSSLESSLIERISSSSGHPLVL